MNKEVQQKILKIWNENPESLTFRDFYTFPFRECKITGWIWDKCNNFAFQCEALYDDNVNNEQLLKLLSIINGDDNISPFNCNTIEFKLSNHKDLILFRTNSEQEYKPLFLIRGWGNLTGTGAYNFKSEIAVKIQDTLAEYIYQRLTEHNVKHNKNGKHNRV